MGLDNDTRGWIMSCVSGVACVLGSTIICVDVIARYFGKRDFRITDSDVFLSSSMSLSAGVLLFTSLYSMLPTSHKYLVRAGYSRGAAAFLLISLFLLGVIVIKIVSGFIHQYMPSHVVSCAHTHEEDGKDVESVAELTNANILEPEELSSERTPLLSPSAAESTRNSHIRSKSPSSHPSLVRALLSGPIGGLVGAHKTVCDENGPCYGVSQACGQECRKVALRKDPELTIDTERPILPKHHTVSDPLRVGELGISGTGTASLSVRSVLDEDLTGRRPVSSQPAVIEVISGETLREALQNHDNMAVHQHIATSNSTVAYSQGLNTPRKHHHHVPQNAFLSLGLQTSLAIALHKLPEGFITYATNHTNPSLGWSVFIALFIHNITEGFAMALPLYLALNSRLKAVAWSSILGGVSQPAGAALAALWIWGVRRANGHGPGDIDDTDGVSWAVYGGMFAATAGVMTNVSLQLFSEGLVLSHNQNLCVGCAIAGMGILGLSFALTA